MFNQANTWPEKALGALFDLARQPVTPSAYPKEEFAHYSIPAWDETRSPTLELGSSIGSSKIAITQPTILVSKLNPHIPRVAFVENLTGPRHCASTEFMPYVAKSGAVVLRFYKWFFDSQMFQRRLVRIATGSTNSHKRARPSETLGWEVPFPSPEDQQHVAAVLDTVDDAIAKTEAVIAKLRQVRAGLLHDLLSCGLDSHGQLRDPITHPEQFQDSPLGRIPREWHCSKFDEVLDDIDAGKSPDYPDYPAPPGEWGVLKVSAIWPKGFRPNENKWVTKAAHQVPEYQVRDGDLLISRSNTYELVGLVCLVENAPRRLILCDKTLRLRLKANKGLNPFFCQLLQTRTSRVQIEIDATGTSGSMKNISQVVIRGLQLAYPEVDEQRRILDAVQPADQELKAWQRELRKLTSLKSGLMTDLLTGRVRVPVTSATSSGTT